MNIEQTITDIVGDILRVKGRDAQTLEPHQDLYGDGIGLDSLDAAELSVRLENAFGRDAFSTGRFPRTLKDLFEYYSKQ